MSKITIIEGNSNDKDNVRNFMVKGEPGSDGVSPSASVTRGTNKATVNITDAEGTTSADLYDGVSPTVTAEKEDKTTTITITDIDGTRTTEINDGVDLTGGVPTNGVIAFDGVQADIPDGYEVSSTSIATITDEYSTSASEGYSANYINNEIKSKVTSLWKGEKNTTGSVTLSDEYSNYDLIAFTIASNNVPNRKTEFVWAKDIIINGELNFSIFQSSSVWVSVSCTFTSTTNFNIGNLHKQTWNSVYLIEISGIKL